MSALVCNGCRSELRMLSSTLGVCPRCSLKSVDPITEPRYWSPPRVTDHVAKRDREERLGLHAELAA